MATYYERIDTLRASTNFTVSSYEAEYIAAEHALADLFGEYIKGAEILSSTYGAGKVVSTSGDALEHMLMEVEFAECNKKFGVLLVITGKVLFSKFADISEVGDAWDHAFDLHTDLTRKLSEFKQVEKLAEAEAIKKAVKEQKAEKQYEANKLKNIKNFEELSQAERTISTTDEFYYSLGWLTAHVGTIQAAIPDYLKTLFEKEFGTSVAPYVYDSKKKTSGGFAYQWSTGFQARLRTKGLTEIPALLAGYLSSDNAVTKKITNTAFIWDIIKNYGFQFGKTQDITKIKDCIPSNYLSSFEAGLLA